MSTLRLMAFVNRLADSVAGNPGVSRFSRVEFPCMHGVPGLRRVHAPLAVAQRAVLPSDIPTPSALWRSDFAAQYPACMCPCQRFDGRLATNHA